jgi:Uma2 family endonuclease
MFTGIREIQKEDRDVLPTLVVEVVAPEATYTSVMKKVRRDLTRGIRMVGVVDPEDRSVTVFQSGKPTTILEEGDTISGDDALPGFSCLVRELFP